MGFLYQGICIICVLLAGASGAHSQKQNHQWRFGGRGAVSFNTSPPEFVSGAALNTPEGGASVADRNTGALLFYTDGVTVWNAQDQVMPNGTGLLGGSATLLSSTTAAVIIPKPGSPTEYYLIAIDEQFGGNGVTYSLVDMVLDGGRGDVVAGQKNIPLLNTDSEKLEVVPASDGQSLWLLTHDNPGNTFYAYRVTSSGIQTTPVISTVGGSQGNGSGHMKVNRQFNKLALGNLFDRKVELFDFDNSTGILSNPVIWDFDASNPGIYGVEFSPNGALLYISNLEFITQYDIRSSAPADIQNSRYVLPVSGFSQRATLQLGPDNKIYVNAGSLDVIDCPDFPGAACGYRSNAIANQLGGGGYGLPKWVFYPGDSPILSTNTIQFADSCLDSPTTFSLSSNSDVTGVVWNFGDPASGSGNTANGLIVSHLFSQAGTYSVIAILTTLCGTDTLLLDPLTIVDCNAPCSSSINPVVDSCSQTPIAFALTTTSNPLNVTWNFGDPASGSGNTATGTTASHTFAAAGTYRVTAIVSLSCGTYTTELTVSIIDCASPCNANIIAPSNPCIRQPLGFSVSSSSAISDVRWNFGDPASGSGNSATQINTSHVFNNPGSYVIQAIINLACGRDTVETPITLVDCDSLSTECRLYLPTAFTPDGNGKNDGFGGLSRCTLETYECDIFNRWGQRIFQTRQPGVSWNGTYKGVQSPSGTYVYMIRYKFPSLPLHQVRGSLQLLR